MKRRCQLLALLLSAALCLSLSVPAVAEEADESSSPDETVQAILLYDDGADADQLARQLMADSQVSLVYRYDLLLRGAAVETAAGHLDALEALAGVAQVVVSQTYSQPQSITTLPTDSTSLSMIGAEAARAAGLTGDGMVIAVLDTGLRVTHEAFTDYGLATSPALSQDDIQSYVSGGGTEGIYVSARIPFAYDYADRDSDVSTSEDHGTHVSALALGYALDEDGGVKFQGVAPAAQLLSMKVFSDVSATANDADILKAIEDAYALGADVINLSLGTDNGFTVDELYADLFQTLREQGVILCCAAGNSSTIVEYKDHGVTLPSTSYTDYGSVGCPSTSTGAVSIAAVNASLTMYESYIQAGEHSLPYIDGQADSGDLPALASLAGQSLTYVVVGGLGTAEDFAAVDVAGKVALVSRGEITFTEKARNAQEAGAVACLIYNNTSGSIIPAVDDVDIPCASVTQKAGRSLIELAGDAGQGVLTVCTDPLLVTGDGKTTMLSASAWGTTSDLHLAPALSAPGGTILSATTDADDAYVLMSGTSMAAPNASGAFALMLQSLKAQGYSKTERADLAEALLESTAELVTDSEGTPLSPRRQGAGLVELSAALASDLVIDQPLLELGDSAAGSFTASFRLRNLSDHSKTVTLSATALTDNYGEDEELGSYSLLSPLDITDGVSFRGLEPVTIAAGGSATVTVTITVSAALRQSLSQVFDNGFFTEGYITAQSADGDSVHATFLGYCGDWQAAPIVDQADFRDALDATAYLDGTIVNGVSLLEQGYSYLDVVDGELGVNLVYVTDDLYDTDDAIWLGGNPYGIFAHNDARNAMASQHSDALYSAGWQFTTDVYTLRNAAHLVMVISDQDTGEVYYVDDTPWLSKAALDEATGEISPSGWFYWNGTDADGRPLEGGAAVTVAFYGWLDSDSQMQAAYESHAPDSEDPSSYRWLTSGYDRCLQWSFPITIDSAAPTLASAPVYDAVSQTLTVTVTDDQFLAYAALSDASGTVLAEEAFDDTAAAEAHTLTVDLSGYDTLPDALYLTAADYATNYTGLSIDLTRAQAATHLCAMALLTDVSRDSWYHEAVDYVYANGIMTGVDTLTFSPNGTITRAQVVTILYRLAGCPEVDDGELPFDDVSTVAWYRDALAWAYEVGIAKGVSATAFSGTRIVTRQELAAFLQRYVSFVQGADVSADADLDRYADGDQVADWARDAVAWAVEAGIIQGTSAATLSPRGGASRAQAAQMLARLLPFS